MPNGAGGEGSVEEASGRELGGRADQSGATDYVWAVVTGDCEKGGEGQDASGAEAERPRGRFDAIGSRQEQGEGDREGPLGAQCPGRDVSGGWADEPTALHEGGTRKQFGPLIAGWGRAAYGRDREQERDE